MESLSKYEPQELRPCHDDAEESKSPSEQWTGESSPTMADKQPQSLIMRESPLTSDHGPD